jgi:phosphonate transport system ATP-binding protein
MESLRAINREEGITVIASLHHLVSARTYCERILGMSDGKIVFDGPPSQLSEEVIREIYRLEDAEMELEHDTENVAVTEKMAESRSEELALRT